MRKRKFRDDEISLDRSHLDTKARTRALSGRSHFVVQSLSCSQFFVTSWTAALQAPLPFTVSWSLLKFISIESVMLSNHLIFCQPPLFSLQSFPASGSFPMNWLFTSGGQNIGASATVLPMNVQG